MTATVQHRDKKKEKTPQMIARTMHVEDLAQIIDIEKKSFPTPWTLGLFLRELKLDYSHNYVFCCDDEVIGYITFWLVACNVHIMSIAVKEDYRRQGVATKILRFALKRARRLDGEYAHLEVRESNDAAIALYKKLKFEIIAKKRYYYSDTGEDALIMGKEL